MADIKFACPSCHQHITCDELWCGQEIACPICQAPLTVPPKPAPKPAVRTTGSGQGHNALVPKPPAAPTPKLSIGAQANTEAPGAGLANRNIPIRNLAPEAKKKKNPVVKILTTIVVVAVLGVGGYYGFQWLMAMQAKSNAASDREMANADGGQVGHISELNNFLDATEPGGAGLGSIPRRQPSGAPRTPGAAGGQAMSADADDETADAGAAAPAEKPLPVIPPVYTLEAEAAKIPEGRVNGMISGTNFVAETVSIVPSTTTQVLKLTQGAEASPDREILVYLKLKAGEKLGGQKITVTKDTRNPAISSVMKRWKTNPRYAPTSKAFSGGFALKLELGQPGEGFIPGKIYLALPDTEQTVVAGVFKATSAQAYADPTAASAVASPVPPAGRNPAETEMMRRRYGR
jgi:hypothetical protein